MDKLRDRGAGKEQNKTEQGSFGSLEGKFSTIKPVRLWSSHPLPGEYYSCKLEKPKGHGIGNKGFFGVWVVFFK